MTFHTTGIYVLRYQREFGSREVLQIPKFFFIENEELRSEIFKKCTCDR